MARLIPSTTDDRTPPGEKAVFGMLAAGPDDWVALHSLDLSPWNRGLRTEIDFLVIVPDTGILCMEVKSHEVISFDDDVWHPREIRRSPFKQACDGRYAFHRALSRALPAFAAIPVLHCCVFPRASFELPPNLSVQPWELVDGREFGRYRHGSAFCEALKARMVQGIESDRTLRPLGERIRRGQVEELVSTCIPVRRRRTEDRQEISRREQEIERVLREQQRPVLRLVRANRRVIVSGGAGTGKTLIAMEVARRAAESGQRVALLCFNRLVGEWMTAKMKSPVPALPNLVVGRAIRVMADMAGLEVPDNPPDSFWDVRLPELLEARLTDPEFFPEAVFDYVVLDETQDILARRQIWDCLKLFIAGGLERGSFVLFGDFENQVLSERDTMIGNLNECEGVARPSHWRLDENCRNYSVIGETAVLLSGINQNVYSGYLRAGGSEHNYDIFFYSDDRAQLEKLGLWISEFRTQGYRNAEITVLSFCGAAAGAAQRLASADQRLQPAWRGGDRIGFTSVHAYKGMENKIVILTDLSSGEQGLSRDLFYVGMTRATESVRLLCAESARQNILDWLKRRGAA